MAEPLDAFWEPRQFAVGDRVSVHLSPECRCYPIRTRPGARFDGAIGTVIGHLVGYSVDGAQGHTLKVVPDRPFTDDFAEVPEDEDYWCIFAAIELETLEPGQ